MIHVVARMELNPGCQEKMLDIMRDLNLIDKGASV